MVRIEKRRRCVRAISLPGMKSDACMYEAAYKMVQPQRSSPRNTKQSLEQVWPNCRSWVDFMDRFNSNDASGECLSPVHLWPVYWWTKDLRSISVGVQECPNSVDAFPNILLHPTLPHHLRDTSNRTYRSLQLTRTQHWFPKMVNNKDLMIVSDWKCFS